MRSSLQTKAAMSKDNKILALDVGERRIGVAIASTIARMPAPLETIDTEVVSDVNSHISGLIKQIEATVLVVGLPRGLDGQESLQTKYVRDFASQLNKHIDIPIVMQDEAVTSVEAEKILKARGKPYSKADIDKEAAAIILNDYLQVNL